MTEEHRDALTGYSGGGVGRTYGTMVPLQVLAKAIWFDPRLVSQTISFATPPWQLRKYQSGAVF